MNTYPLASYALQLTGQYRTLEIKNTTSDVIEESFDLALAPVTVKFTDDQYEVGVVTCQEPALTGIRYADFDNSSNGESHLQFSGSRLGGIGTADIRGMGRSEVGNVGVVKFEIEFYLELCDISLFYEEGVPYNLLVGTRCDPVNGCEYPDPVCSKVEILEGV